MGTPNQNHKKLIHEYKKLGQRSKVFYLFKNLEAVFSEEESVYVKSVTLSYNLAFYPFVDKGT